MRRALVMLATVATLGCIRIGPNTTNETANRPGGSPALVFAGRNSVDGELLAIRDTAYVLLTPTDVVLAPLAILDSARFLDRGKTVTYYRELMPSQRENLRLISRYPPGMPEVALQSLLRARNKSSVTVLTR